MRHLILLALAGLMAGPAMAQVEATAPGLAGADLPPLLDREVFFGNPEISGAQLSPDGAYLTFLRDYEGVRNVWVKGIDEPFDAARPLTADERPVPGYFWSQDGAFVLYVQDKGGDENFHVYAVDPTEAVGGTVPEARNLTDVDGVRAVIYSVPEDDPAHIVVGLNDRDPAYHDVYRVNLASGARELLIENTDEVGGFLFDDAGDVRFAVKASPGGGQDFYAVDAAGRLGEVLYACTFEEACAPAGFHADNERVYMSTNRGDRNLSELVLFDPATQAEEFIERDPEGQVDFGGMIYSDVQEKIVATYYNGDRLRIYTQDDEWAADLAFLRAELPEGDVLPGSMTRDERKMLVTVTRAEDPGSVYLFDRDADTVELLYRSRPELPVEHMASMEAVRYTARDGREIPAYLTLPRGVEAENLPVVMYIHGGPWARDSYGYEPYAQFLANRGYAVLQPNFRSSTGYGKDHLNAGNREWGTGAMQHDITDGVQWLIEQGIADPDRVGIFGGSYGGYATLAGVTFTPDLYAAAVPYVAPSSLITLIESFPAYWRPFLEGSWYRRVGDPADPEDRADLEARSPLNFVDRIETPLLVVHGANDPRVTQRESDQLVIALRDRGVGVEYLVAPDEGHGFRSEPNRMALAASMERFLGLHLGGRVQTEMPSEIEAQLEAITVDPASVTLAAAPEAAEAGAFDASLLAPVTLTYDATIAVQGQEVPLEITRTLDTHGDGFVAVDAVSTPMGAATDSTMLDARFHPVARRVAQGPVSLAFDFAPDRITGEVSAQGTATPVDVALDAPVAADGASLAFGIGTLPLAEGYRASFAGFDSQAQRPQTTVIEVTGRETVEVPAGTFETWVVEMTVGDGTAAGSGTYHVSTDQPGVVVKTEVGLGPQMGGGTATSVLASMD
ncbi:MAG: prolyl oligopeptidase family serine peptidase [Bacteroidota bacterium]